jgi:hypothetical protein
MSLRGPGIPQCQNKKLRIPKKINIFIVDFLAATYIHQGIHINSGGSAMYD